MHLASVIHLLGRLLMFLAVAMLLPLPVSFAYADGAHWALLLSSGLTVAVGFAAFRYTRYGGDLRTKEGFAIVTFGWLSFSLLGSLPFLLSGSIVGLTDAFFETISGFTTTGATILTDVEAVVPSILFWRALTHWLGGMGIIVLSLAVLPFLGVGGMQLFKAEVPGPTADKIAPRLAQTAKLLWGVYVLFTAAETGLLMLGGMNLYEALSHAFATMATGGYSTRNASVAGFDSAYIEYVITFFMAMAGVNFALHYRFLTGDFGAYWRDKEFRYYLGIAGVATLVIGTAVLVTQPVGPARALRDTLFQVFAIITTTGFGTADYEQWPVATQYILFALMFIGGSAGSTSGGMKVMRIYLVVKFVLGEIKQLIHPHAVISVRVNNSSVPREVIANVLGFFALFILIFAAGVLAMTALGLDLPTAFGAVVASLGNIGPGLGDVGPTDNYAWIPGPGKWILSLLMLMGRLELFTVILLFSPLYWRK